MGFATGVVFLILYHNKILRHTQKTLEFSPWLTVLLWLCTIGMVLAVFLSLTKGATRRGVMLGIALSVISLFASIAMHILDPLVIRNLGMIGWKADISPTEPQAYRTSSAMDPWQVLNKGTMFRHYYYTPNLTILNGTLSTGYYLSFIPYWSANLAAWSQKALRGDHSKQIYLDLSSARWLFLPDGSFAEKVGFPTASFKGMKAYENPRAMSRASVVFSRRIFPGEGDLIAFLESSDFDPRRDVAILRQDAEAWDLRSDVNKLKTATIPHEATIVVDRPDRIEIELKPVPSMGGAYLVFSDTYYPGWRALVDGVETKVLRANYAFRGIKLPEGAKHVVFFYDPLVPDAVLPLPTILLASLGGVMCLRHFLIKKHDEGMTLKKPA